MESKPAYKSKTIASGLVTTIAGALLSVGASSPQYPTTFDEFEKPQNNNKQAVLGLGLIGSGLLAVKGRYDVNTLIRRKGEK